MSRKKKHGAQKPPLSALDKAIYWTIIWLSVGFSILFWLGFGIWIPRAIGFSEAGVIACGEQWAMITSLFFACFCMLTITIIVSSGLDKKQPIFGNKEAKPSVLRPMLTVYPLFSKEFWQKLSEKAKKKMLIIGMILVVLFVAFSVLLYVGFYPRTVLYEDMHMERYDITNQMTDIRHLDAADSITLAITRSSSKNGTSYGLSLRIFFGEESYVFTVNEFSKMSNAEALRCMISIKERFGSRVDIIGSEQADQLIRYKKWGSAEKALLYELFELK